MSYPPLPAALRELLLGKKSVRVQAILLAPHLAEGTIIFDPADELLSVIRGDFYPSTIKVIISAIERCQLLVAKAKTVLNVVMFPGRSEITDAERFQFEVVDWRPMEQISRLGPLYPR